MDMATGIYEALITTGLGLLVAVPAYLFYLYFVGRAKRLIHRIERGAIEIVNIICDERDAPKLEDAKSSDDASENKKSTVKKVVNKAGKKQSKTPQQ